MNEFVYTPIAELQMDLMLEEGIIEARGIDKDGEFTYGLSKKGYEEQRRLAGPNSGLQT